MYSSKQSNKFIWVKLLMLPMYACFFAVQFYFNYDIARISSHSKTQVILPFIIKYEKGTLKVDKSKPHKANVWLNKRFQPADATLNGSEEIPVPDYIFISVNKIWYKCQIVPSYPSYLINQRGPPQLS